MIFPGLFTSLGDAAVVLMITLILWALAIWLVFGTAAILFKTIGSSLRGTGRLLTGRYERRK